MIPPELKQRRLGFRAPQAAAVETSGLAEDEESRPSAELGRGSLRAIGLCYPILNCCSVVFQLLGTITTLKMSW